MGCVVLGFKESEVWRMTLYKLLTLFDAHRAYCPERKGFIKENYALNDIDDIDIALGGL